MTDGWYPGASPRLPTPQTQTSRCSWPGTATNLPLSASWGHGRACEPTGMTGYRQDRDQLGARRPRLLSTTSPCPPTNGWVGGLDLHRAIGQARLMLAAALIGLSRASLEFCSAYAVQRTTWGTPIAKHQGVPSHWSSLATEVEEVLLPLWDTAASLDRTRRRRPTSSDRSDRTVNRASSLGMRATRDGVQLVGVRAITRDLPCERLVSRSGGPRRPRLRRTRNTIRTELRSRHDDFIHPAPENPEAAAMICVIGRCVRRARSPARPTPCRRR